MINRNVNNGTYRFTIEQATTIADFTQNILAWYDAATDAQHAEGVEWYARAQRLAHDITRNMRRDGYTIDYKQVAAAIAVTSNNVRWEDQVRNTETFLRLMLDGSDYKAKFLGFMYTYLDKAFDLVVNGNWEALSGPKVSIFYLNIIGQLDLVTVDRHAVRVALNEYTDENLTNRWVKPESVTRAMMEAAYFEAASIVGIEPAVLQAVTWTAYRFSTQYREGVAKSKAQKLAKRSAKLLAA